jgi:hypothetical protein
MSGSLVGLNLDIYARIPREKIMKQKKFGVESPSPSPLVLALASRNFQHPTHGAAIVKGKICYERKSEETTILRREGLVR